jgi:sigma-E factor negative regulatory protein RseA
MTANAQEQISALLDGELPQEELELALRRVARDESLGATVWRFGLVGAALRDELAAGRPADLVAGVRAGLGSAHASTARQPLRIGRSRRLAAGFAVAASVALLALIALPGRQPEMPPPVLSATEVVSPTPDQQLLSSPVFTRTAGGGPDRLTSYYVNHTGYAPALSGRGALTRIIVIQPEAAPAAEREPEDEESPPESGSAR